MKISRMLANITPVCACRGYVEAGHTLKIVAGRSGERKAWWVACPDCGNALGRAMSYPVLTTETALTKRGYINRPNANA